MKIYAKALEKGLIQADATLSEEELFNLIFLPGFSTASQTTDVSGRGVGMDVVQSSISSLHGEIRLASHKEQGTTVTLTIPLTLAIIDGLLVTVGKNYYLLNLENVAECLEFTEAKCNGGSAFELIQVKGDFIPVLFLRKALDETTEQVASPQVVVVKANDRLLGLVVDKIVGQFQSVIKPLSHSFTPVHLFSGASILGDGTIALILDINRLEKLVSGNANKTLRV